MKKRILMLCTLGFMGLQGADGSGMEFTIRTQPTPPGYRPPEAGTPVPAMRYPSAPIADQLQDLSVLKQFTPDQLLTAAAQIHQAQELADIRQEIVARRTHGLPNSAFRTQGPLPIPLAGRHRSAPAAAGSSPLERLRHEASVFDSTDSEEDMPSHTENSRHRRQRSASDTEALTKPGYHSPDDSTCALERWHQPAGQNSGISLTTPSLDADSKPETPTFDLTVLSENSKTVLKHLQTAAIRARALIRDIEVAKYNILVSVEDKADAPTNLQKATAKEREKQQKKTREAHVALDDMCIRMARFLRTKK